MQRGGQLSFISQVLGRQLEGGAVHKRPFVAEFRCEGACSGTVINNPGLTGTPAFAAEYSRVYNDSKLLAIADEEGFVSIVDTSAELPSEMADDWGPNKPKAQWLAHRNAVFDIAWCHDDSRMLTASGDQTLGLWDTGHADALGSFRGHSGSVKAVAPLPHNNAVFASGARDGALMLWDAREAARSDGVTGEPFHSPVATVHDAHALGEKHRRRRTPLQGRTRPSVTSLAFLDGTGSQLATGGVDGIVKFWDLRQTGGGATAEAAPGLQLARLCDASAPHISQKQHGITSLSLHPQGSQLLVSLMGGHHLVYDPLRPAIGPTRWFGGHTVASFYVKAAWSPDGSHILSGSTDRCAYVWEVDAPDGASPYVLSGHQGEVTAVAWCPSDFHQIATIADDATLKVWHIQRRQPEEQADDGTPRHPWVYPWQQQRQLEAAAAAAAACDGAVRGAGDTPGPVPQGDQEPGSAPRTSAAAAAGPRSGGDRGVPSTVRSGRRAAGSAGDENRHTNLARSPLQQHAQVQADADLAQRQRQRQQLAAADGQQQQQQQHWAASHTADAGRPQPYLTPSAAAAARGATAAGSPLAAVGGSALPATAGPSSRRMRRVGDLLQSAPSTRRRTQQTSIAAFLRSPAAGAVAGGVPSPCTAAGAAAGSRLPEPACGSAGRTTARKRGNRVAAGGSAGPPLPLALPGLGGSGLPLADQRSKRLRVSFERAGVSAEAAVSACTAAAQQRQQGPRPGGAGAAAQLEPSPELAAKLGAGKLCSDAVEQPQLSSRANEARD